MMDVERYAKVARRLSTWPFRSPLAAPVWFIVRIYLGAVWLRFGWGKIDAGWLRSNPMEPILQAIASGGVRAPLAPYAVFAETLLAAGFAPMLSVAIPLAEVAFGLAFIAGVWLVPAAMGACLLNINLLSSGIASWSFDGRILLLQLLVVLAWRVAGDLGLGDSLRRLRRAYVAEIDRLRHA